MDDPRRGERAEGEQEQQRERMHLYNAWLPPPVAEETKSEKESFAVLVRSVKEAWRPEDPDSVYSTLKWIAVIQLYIKAKSVVSLADVEVLVEVGLDVFNTSQNKLYAQVRWGNILVRILKKFGKKLSLKVQWRPFYDMLMRTHFKRNTGPEGWRLRQRHFVTLTSLVRSCRKFFPSGSASEIWSEFSSGLENPWHNSAFEGSGFVKLFLPMNSENKDFFTNEWVRQCIDLWDMLTNCQFWDVQWATVIARCIKHFKLLDWEHFLPALFTQYLNMFEVPVSNRSGSYPFSLDVPGNTRYLFSSKSGIPAKAVANAIVHLLKPGSSAQQYFEKLANLLEQYYHPSNGGRWTYSLECFLRHLVLAFLKRLQREQSNRNEGKMDEFCLGKSERVCFVKMILKIIDRGQYSKSDTLAETVASAISILSYVEPSLVLPFVASRFHLALETMTATHQLKAAVTSVAFTLRPLLLSSGPESLSPSCESFDPNMLMISLSNALLGMDANDPPKTLATMQLIASIFSNLTVISDDEDVPAALQNISFSEWLDEFFDRLFSLLQHLEPNNIVNEGINMSNTCETFLVEDSSYYFCMLQILLGKLSKPLFDQSLKKISKFANTNILPGAVAEVGLLCCASVYSNPEDAATYLIKPILMSITNSLKEFPGTGFGGNGCSNATFSTKATLSPALETTLEYHLKILSMLVSYGGPVLLNFRDELRDAVTSAFNAPSWKVYGAGDNLLRSLFGSLVTYYPIGQHKCSHQSDSSGLEEWVSSKTNQAEELQLLPKWHIPCTDEISFANELLDLHLRSALDDLSGICQMKLHSEAGNEKEHLKVTLLRIFSSLQGVQSCLPDIRPSYKNAKIEDQEDNHFLIAGMAGSNVGSAELREKAVEVIHGACKYLLDERSDDSILLILVIRIMDALGNFGSIEYREWLSHVQSWKFESASIMEPPCNFIVSSDSSQAQGKKRPRWAVIEKVHMHSIWRSSQASYHRFRTSSNLSPSQYIILLMEDLLSLALHQYESVRLRAGKSLIRLLKRWPPIIAQCVLCLTGNLHDPKVPEHVILGSCNILTSQTVLRHLTTDASGFSSFILGLLASSHHESLKAQKAISELFVKYNIHFSGIPKHFFKLPDNPSEHSEFIELVSQISSLSFGSNGLHWRYDLMANRVLLLLTLASRSDSSLSSQVLGATTGHFLRSLKSQQPQSRILAISALNALLQGSRHKTTVQEQCPKEKMNPSLEDVLTQIFQEDDFFSETLNRLSHVHLITDTEGSSSRANYGLQTSTDTAITSFYFDFSSSWPRTPSWVSLFGGDSFYSKFARIFKRLTQECGTPVVLAIRAALEELISAKERPMQCVAAEALAGILHSDINDLLAAWNEWVIFQIEKIISAPSVESIPEWAACIRYAVTGKGKYGIRAPLLRQQILDCLLRPLPQVTATSIVAKRYIFLSAALLEISPPRMPLAEVQYHDKLLKELWDNMSHSSAQVREAIGVALCIICSNLRLFSSRLQYREPSGIVDISLLENWAVSLKAQAFELAGNILHFSPSENSVSATDLIDENGLVDTKLKDDIRKMEMMFHFIISSLRSRRSSYLLDMIVALLYPVISLQETSHKDLSILAKAAFELLKWRILPRPYLEDAVSVVLTSTNDPNWRTRFASLTYLQTFVYRHTFILSNGEKQRIWTSIEQLLLDNQVEIREHAAGVLASLMKGGDADLAMNFRHRALKEAQSIDIRRKQRTWRSSHSIVSLHGAVLALVASVLSVPYDMPSWLPEHVSLLAKFVNEPSPIKSTVTKAVAEFRRTHADTWMIQKDSFTEEQLEILADVSSSSSYFA